MEAREAIVAAKLLQSQLLWAHQQILRSMRATELESKNSVLSITHLAHKVNTQSVVKACAQLLKMGSKNRNSQLLLLLAGRIIRWLAVA